MTKYYMKPSHKLSLNLGEDQLTVTKTYILIVSSINSSHFTINTNNNLQSTTNKLPNNILSLLTPYPISFMFEHCFVVPHYYEALDKAYGLNSIENEQIFEKYRREKFAKVIQGLKVSCV
jgi:hypothetical protein